MHNTPSFKHNISSCTTHHHVSTVYHHAYTTRHPLSTIYHHACTTCHHVSTIYHHACTTRHHVSMYLQLAIYHHVSTIYIIMQAQHATMHMQYATMQYPCATLVCIIQHAQPKDQSSWISPQGDFPPLYAFGEDSEVASQTQ